MLQDVTSCGGSPGLTVLLYTAAGGRSLKPSSQPCLLYFLVTLPSAEICFLIVDMVLRVRFMYFSNASVNKNSCVY